MFNLKKFDYTFLSFEIGYAKPDLKIFEYALDKMKIEAKNVLFIDDSFKNISAARALGFKVCHATGLKLDKIKNYVEDFLNDE